MDVFPGQALGTGFLSLLFRPLSQLAYWVHDLDPVIFQFTETIAVRWYGLAYVGGFLVAFALLNRYWKRGRSSLSPPMMENLGLAMILGVVLGGRLGYFLLYETALFLGDPLVFFRVWEGGMASHGGFAGVMVAGLWVARKYRLSALHLGDLVVTVTPPGLLFGILANLINGELWGKVSDVPWAVIFPQSARQGTPVEMIDPRHPSQLYQAGLEGLILLVYMQWRFWSFPKVVREKPGHLMGEFLIGYSLVRWIGELFREPDATLILNVSRGSFYSLFLFLAGAGLILWIRNRKLTTAQSR